MHPMLVGLRGINFIRDTGKARDLRLPFQLQLGQIQTVPTCMNALNELAVI
jgi:hypothetical protein